jgi:hypothetical protein
MNYSVLDDAKNLVSVLLHLDGVTVAIAQKPQNGDVARMAQERCVMLVVYVSAL